MQSSAAALRGSPAAGAAGAALSGLKTFSRRSKQLSEFPQALASLSPPGSHNLGGAGAGEEGTSKASAMVDGKLNFRVRKRRQPAPVNKAQVTEPVAASNPPPTTGEDIPTVATLESTEVEISAVATGTKTRVKRQSVRVLLKQGAESQQSLEVKSLGAAELSENHSRSRTFRRESKKNARAAMPKPQVAEMGFPAPTAAATDLWPSSLSENSGGAIVNVLMEAAEPAILLGKTLTAAEDLAKGLEHLKSADPLLKTVIEMHDAPEFEKCDSCFSALTRSIVFQQLATKAAAVIFGRLVTLCEGLDKLTPTTISQLSALQLRAVGLSERKASYLHDLAANFLSGAICDSSLREMDDESLMKALTAVKGIGVWSVHMFMLFSLHKADVLPWSDLGVRKGLHKLYELKELPNPAAAEKIASCWQPYRSLGSWYMWRLMSNTPIVKLSD